MPPRADADRPSAGDVLLRHLDEQVARVRAQEPLVLADAPDAVHAMRVATRRLRSALRTFRPLLAPGTGRLRAELRWLAGELGGARDAEVLRDRLVRAVAEVTGAGAGHAGDVEALVAAQLEALHGEAHAEVVGVLGSGRYRRLLADLDALVTFPALAAAAGRPAETELRRHVARGWRDLDDLVSRARAAPPGPARDDLLHEARKAAKQVRYAAEAVVPAHGAHARRLAAAVARVQEVLGEHQDSVVARQRLHDLALAAPPGVAFVYGRLHAREEARAAAGEGGLAEAWRAAGDARLHRWHR